MATRLLRQYGTPQQQDKYLAKLCAGEIKASFCLTEESGGTDILQAMRTKAKRVDEGWRLTGGKYWISGAIHADLLIVLARTSDHRSRGVTMFLVDKTDPWCIGHRNQHFCNQQLRYLFCSFRRRESRRNGRTRRNRPRLHPGVEHT
ncbi:acyl-CoA dehydrogenase [Pseudomonas putida S11]|nr:acyl-CoA dehydrogenase [Pseudomonas putida S11]